MSWFARGALGVRAAGSAVGASVARVAWITRLPENDDRRAFALLMAPFFIVAFAIAANLSVQPGFRFDRLLPELVAPVGIGPARDVLVSVGGSGERLLRTSPGPVVRTVEDLKGGEVVAHSGGGENAVRGLGAGQKVSNVGAGDVAPVSVSVTNGTMIDPVPAGTWLGEVRSSTRLTAASRFGSELGGVHRSRSVGGRELDGLLLAPADAPFEGQALAGVTDGQILKWPSFAEGGGELGQRGETVFTRSRYAAAAVASALLLNGDVRLGRIEPGRCAVPLEQSVGSSVAMAVPGSSRARMSRSGQIRAAGSFGLALARVARAQVNGFVIYNDRYMEIGYPMGDVPALYGVCTDVVIRAYRELGVDLQELVYRSRIGNRDRNIGHRRVKTLRRFFERNATVLPITSFAEDYKPGDIVTYHRPQNRGSQFHIGIVSTEFAPSGRLKLIHNRGWGPQIEDALFVDVITGHYRYQGPDGDNRARTTASAEGARDKWLNR